MDKDPQTIANALSREDTAESRKLCADCGAELDDYSGSNVLDDGRVVCDDCFGQYGFCEFCSEQMLWDDMTWWGDNRICRDCLDEYIPSDGFSEEENEEETEDEYEEFCDGILGLVADLAPGETTLETERDSDTGRKYYITVKVDEEGYIEDVSRLTCDVLLSESTTSCDIRPYPIEAGDYELYADDLISEVLADDEEDE